MKARKSGNYDYLVKLSLLGNMGVGRSFLKARFCGEEYPPRFMTCLAIDFSNRTIELDGKRIKLIIWDTEGQERLPSYYREPMGILLTFDVTNQESFNDIRYWMKLIEQHSSKGVNIILIGNKVDMVDKKVISKEQGEALAEELGIKYFECSAISNIGVEEAFFTLVRDVKTRLIDTEQDQETQKKQEESDKK